MKRNILFKNMGNVCLAIALLATTLFTSCKDTSPGSVDFSKSPALLGWQYAGFTPTPYNAVMLPTGTFTENAQVALSVPSIVLSSAVSAKVVDITSVANLDAYNKANGLDAADGDALEPLPTSDYTVPTTVTVPAGQHIVNVPVAFNAGAINFPTTFNYAIMVVLASPSGAILATNLDTAVVILHLKSKYQGYYNVTGSFVDETNPTKNPSGISDAGIYPIDGVQLQTAAAYTVDYYDPNTYGGFSGYYQGITSNGGGSVYGSFAPVFTFDPTTNKVVGITNYYGQNSGPHVRAAELDPAVPATASGTPGTAGFTFTVGFIMTESGNPRTYFNETFTETAAF
jgi:hypothetical protein